MREYLAIAADIATIVTALCAASYLIKISISVNATSSKRASQVAKGDSNKQKISQ
jgi:hypothetical protein